VALTFADLVIMAVLVALGCVVTYVSMQRRLRRIVVELQQSSRQQLDALTQTLKAGEERVAELKRPAATPPVVAPVAVPAAKAQAAPPTSEKAAAPPKQETQEEVTPEMLVVIAAAVTAFLGKKVRIRSAKMLQSPYEIVNPWSQQGRVFVQASHNLRSR
jgi:methylmalonyl-CoA carboxyltransferase large subunit